MFGLLGFELLRFELRDFRRSGEISDAPEKSPTLRRDLRRSGEISVARGKLSTLQRDFRRSGEIPDASEDLRRSGEISDAPGRSPTLRGNLRRTAAKPQSHTAAKPPCVRECVPHETLGSTVRKP